MRNTGIRLAGLFVEADRLSMTALADLAAVGGLVPTVTETFRLDQAGIASPPSPVLARRC